jgi:septum formation protein
MTLEIQSGVHLILASTSPRRAAYLEQLGVKFSVVGSRVEESVRPGEGANDYVRRLALNKAETVCADVGRIVPVLGADTAVVIDSEILGKPNDFDAARRMLARLSGMWHEVYTGVAVVGRTAEVIGVRTRVKFRLISTAEVDAYWASGEPVDKAGAYAIQGLGAAFVERIDGSYSNVVGLPLVETLQLLAKHGITHTLDSAQPQAR